MTVRLPMRRVLVLGSALCSLWALSACALENDPPPAPPAEEPSAASGAVLWQSTPYGEPAGTVQPLGDGIIALTPTTTTLLDHDGNPVWEVEEPENPPFSPQTLIAGEVVVRHAQPDGQTSERARIRVLDGRTGELLWTRVGLDNLRAEAGALYATSCERNGSSCRVLALDAASGSLIWQAPAPAVHGIDLSGSAVIATSYPDGTDLTPDPYAPLTQVDVLDAATGERIGDAQRGVSFDVVDTVLIEQVYAGSTGRSCTLTLSARTLAGKHLWDHTATWTRAGDDSDCTRAPLLLDRPGGVELTGIPGHHELVELRTGRATPTDGAQVVATSDGVEVRVAEGQAQGIDDDGRTLWEAEAPGQVSSADQDILAFGVTGSDGQQRSVLRDVRSGEVVLDVNGRYVGSGDGWIAVYRRSGDSTSAPGRLVLLDWPH